MSPEWTPQSNAAKSVFEAGFLYDPEQDIIYSRRDARQRDFGYAYAYDVAAPTAISAIIDCEPFFFHYEGKHWMIELWKGQYGIETGAEIGIYLSSGPHPILDLTLGSRPHDPENGKFFRCAQDAEQLRLSFTLKKDGIPLFNRGPESHWWLTGFRWGILSAPEQLSMDVGISFPRQEMRELFCDALEKTGYTDIEVVDNSVGFTFAAPKTKQPRLDPVCQTLIAETHQKNAHFVEKYNELELADNDPNGIPDDFCAFFGKFQKKNLQNYFQDLFA